MLRSITSTNFKNWTPVPLRAALGLIFLAHGIQKVFGGFGGRGLRTFMYADPPFPWMWPGPIWMGAAAFAELIGGVMVLIGLFTRAGASAISMVMLTALFGVHWGNFFVQDRGIEFPFALLCMAVALIHTGGGRFSVDAHLRL